MIMSHPREARLRPARSREPRLRRPEPHPSRSRTAREPAHPPRR